MEMGKFRIRATDNMSSGPTLSNNSSISKGPWTTDVSISSHSLTDVSEFGTTESTSSNLPPPPSYREATVTMSSSSSCCFKCTNEEDNDEPEVLSEADKSVRQRFIRNVYLILLCQLVFALTMSCIFRYVNKVKVWVSRNMWFTYISFPILLVILVTLCCLMCCKKENKIRRFPGNIIGLLVLSLSYTHTCLSLATYIIGPFVLTAVGITTLVTLGIVLFTMQNKSGFHVKRGLICSITGTLLLTGLALLVVYAVVPDDSKTIYYIWCGIGGFSALLMTSVQIYATKAVWSPSCCEGEEQSATTDDTIFIAMTIYIFMIVSMYSLFGKSED